MSDKKFTNQLIKETSPYLLQHAHNPVNWYPWGEEAFEIAKKEDKPIFLSVGYSACHWCHVMEHESFENEDTAKIMNELFVNIKVDREERPDIDSIYMNVVQMLTGHGGWPMSVFLTPDKKPFYGGTYFPDKRRYNMPSFREVLVSLSDYYHQKKDNLKQNTDSIIKNLKTLNHFETGKSEISYKQIEKAIKQLDNYFDYHNGGFGTQPKFPNTFNLDLLLRHYLNTNDLEYLEMVELTLKKMCHGGIYDQLGGGFYRYSVDDHWLIPHFEKMLYDNSLLIKLLLEVYQITKDDFYKDKAKESLDYVIREMTQEQGGFYSTQDADSEGEEGKFYTWTKDEIIEVLGEYEGELVSQFFDITEEGNFEHGKSNLQILESIEYFADEKEIGIQELEGLIENAKLTLFNVRDKRIYPGKDTKVLTSWNGLMVSAFAKGYQVTGNKKYLDIAEKTVDFILNNLMRNGLLLRSYKDNQSKFNAYLEDYAFLVQALIDLHQITLNNKFIFEAEKLNNIMIEQFLDQENGAFFYTGKNHEELIVKTKEIIDHSIPSGNSVAIRNLLRLSRLTDNKRLQDIAEKALKVFSVTIDKYSSGVSNLLCVIDEYLKPPSDLVLVGENFNSIKPFIKKANEEFSVNRLIYFYIPEESAQLSIFKDKRIINNQPTAYLCNNFVCKKPVNNPKDLIL